MKLDTMVEELSRIKEIADQVQLLKTEFSNKTGYGKDLSDSDFLGLIMMTPAVAIAMADKELSFFEMRYMGKKAREYSKGWHFLFKDPVANGLHVLSKNLEEWEKPFMEITKLVLKFQKDDKFLINEMNQTAQSAGGLSSAINNRLFLINSVLLTLPGAFFIAWILGPIRAGKTAISKEEKGKIIDIAEQLGIRDSINFKELEEYLMGN
ncbi:hypothetical protein KJ966_20775 [bacterium]|nr:hypothetical protein [bacterium]